MVPCTAGVPTALSQGRHPRRLPARQTNGRLVNACLRVVGDGLSLRQQSRRVTPSSFNNFWKFLVSVAQHVTLCDSFLSGEPFKNHPSVWVCSTLSCSGDSCSSWRNQTQHRRTPWSVLAPQRLVRMDCGASEARVQKEYGTSAGARRAVVRGDHVLCGQHRDGSVIFRRGGQAE